MEVILFFLLGLLSLFWPAVALMALALFIRICLIAKRVAAIAEDNLELNRQRTAHLEKIATVLGAMNTSASTSDLPQ